MRKDKKVALFRKEKKISRWYEDEIISLGHNKLYLVAIKHRDKRSDYMYERALMKPDGEICSKWYDHYTELVNGRFLVVKGEEKTVIDENGRELIGGAKNIQSVEGRGFQEAYAISGGNEKYLIFENGERIFAEYRIEDIYNDGLLRVSKDGKECLLDKSGKELRNWIDQIKMLVNGNILEKNGKLIRITGKQGEGKSAWYELVEEDLGWEYFIVLDGSGKNIINNDGKKLFAHPLENIQRIHEWGISYIIISNKNACRIIIYGEMTKSEWFASVEYIGNGQFKVVDRNTRQEYIIGCNLKPIQR